MKKILSITLGVAFAVTALYLMSREEQVDPVAETDVNPIQLCFYGEKKTPRGLYDVAWLKMNLSGDQVTGELRNLPAEKDSKLGTFEGTVGEVDSRMMARTADVWWNALAEGMQAKEQLKIVFGEGNAAAGFGEMVDRGDSVYVYKDASKLVYGMSMTDVACRELEERIMVEKYIRDNIGKLAPEKPALGGTFYATMVHLVPANKTGELAYEDGHIDGKAIFSYAVNNGVVAITKVSKL